MSSRRIDYTAWSIVGNAINLTTALAVGKVSEPCTLAHETWLAPPGVFPSTRRTTLNASLIVPCQPRIISRREGIAKTGPGSASRHPSSVWATQKRGESEKETPESQFLAALPTLTSSRNRAAADSTAKIPRGTTWQRRWLAGFIASNRPSCFAIDKWSDNLSWEEYTVDLSVSKFY